MSTTGSNQDRKQQTLGSFCEFKYGRSLPEKDRRGGEFPVYGSNGIVGFHDTPLTTGPTIIIGRKGSAGALQFSDRPCCPIDTTYYVDGSCTQTDLKWLYFMLHKLGLSALNKHVAVPGLNRNDAYEKELLVPSLHEQKKIAAVLDKAELLRRQRQDSLHLAERLLQSVFLNMFVRSAEATHWTRRRVDWMAKDAKGAIRTGPFGSQLLHSEFVDSGIAVLGIDNAVKNHFEWGQPRFITPEKYQNLKRYKVYPGDLIITIMGTLGRCAIVPDDIPEAINTKHLCCITLDQEKCLPEFLHASFLNHPDLLRQLGIRTKGAVMPGLNMGIIKDLELPLPPLELQQQFKRIVDRCIASRTDQEVSQEVISSLFGSILQRAFRAELDLSRLELDAQPEAPSSHPVAEPLTTEHIIDVGRRQQFGGFVAPPEIEARMLDLEAKLDGKPGNSIPWSEEYFKYRTLSRQLHAPYSFKEIWEKVIYDMEDSSYEIVKEKIFEYLAQGILEQRFDDERNELIFYPRQ